MHSMLHSGAMLSLLATALRTDTQTVHCLKALKAVCNGIKTGVVCCVELPLLHSTLLQARPAAFSTRGSEALFDLLCELTAPHK